MSNLLKIYDTRASRWPLRVALVAKFVAGRVLQVLARVLVVDRKKYTAVSAVLTVENISTHEYEW